MMAVFEPKFSMKLDKAAAAPAADALFETKLHFMFENQSEKEKLFGKVFFLHFHALPLLLMQHLYVISKIVVQSE